MEGLNKYLLFAAEDHSENAIKKIDRLIKSGVNINYNDGNFDALYLAAYEGNEKTVKFLLENGANPNFINKQGENALYASIDRDMNVEIVKMLLDAGSSIRIKVKTDKGTKTLLSIVDEKLNHFSSSPYFNTNHPHIKQILTDCNQVLELFYSYYKDLLDEDKKIIQKYRLRKLFN